MNDAASDILSQLRDIHSAAEPSWWPPAPGWWVIAVLIVVLLVLLLRVGAGKWVARRRKQRFLQALEQIRQAYDPVGQPHEYLSHLNRLFRAVALRAFPGTESSRLQGESWVGFLRTLLPETHADSLDALATGPYEPAPVFDAEGLQAQAREWVKRYG